ncbi:MAG: hypothetical protein AB2A00_01970 [Myxococcota bacterium]
MTQRKKQAQPKHREPGRTPDTAGAVPAREGQIVFQEPGRTPGSAEGDRDTVEEDLRSKGLDH